MPGKRWRASRYPSSCCWRISAARTSSLPHATLSSAIELATALEDIGVAISVRDTGPGIPPDVLPHIFERFYRGAVSRSGVSTGLGLAIAKELIEVRAARSPSKAGLDRAAYSP